MLFNALRGVYGNIVCISARNKNLDKNGKRFGIITLINVLSLVVACAEMKTSIDYLC